MAKIKLTQGKFALIDDEDFEKVNKYKWYTNKMFGINYAGRSMIIKNKQKKLLMHRFIMNLGFGNKKQIDHINSNGLDNRRCNLRICTNQQNIMCKRINKTYKTSKYKGVRWYKQYKKWATQIVFNYRKIFLGYFENEEDAALVYNKKAKELFGEYARLNKIHYTEGI